MLFQTCMTIFLYKRQMILCRMLLKVSDTLTEDIFCVYYSFKHSVQFMHVWKSLIKNILLATIKLLFLIRCILCQVSPEMVKHLTRGLSHPVNPLYPEAFDQPAQLISFMRSHPVLACLSSISSHRTGQGLWIISVPSLKGTSAVLHHKITHWL